MAWRGLVGSNCIGFGIENEHGNEDVLLRADGGIGGCGGGSRSGGRGDGTRAGEEESGGGACETHFFFSSL